MNLSTLSDTGPTISWFDSAPTASNAVNHIVPYRANKSSIPGDAGPSTQMVESTKTQPESSTSQGLTSAESHAPTHEPAPGPDPGPILGPPTWHVCNFCTNVYNDHCPLGCPVEHPHAVDPLSVIIAGRKARYMAHFYPCCGVRHPILAGYPYPPPPCTAHVPAVPRPEMNQDPSQMQDQQLVVLQAPPSSPVPNPPEDVAFGPAAGLEGAAVNVNADMAIPSLGFVPNASGDVAFGPTFGPAAGLDQAPPQVDTGMPIFSPDSLTNAAGDVAFGPAAGLHQVPPQFDAEMAIAPAAPLHDGGFPQPPAQPDIDPSFMGFNFDMPAAAAPPQNGPNPHLEPYAQPAEPYDPWTMDGGPFASYPFLPDGTPRQPYGSAVRHDFTDLLLF